MKCEVAKLYAGNQFRRPRGFRPAEYGSLKWWTVGVRAIDDAPAKGWHILSVYEVVLTQTFGRLVIFHEWITDPDGAAVRPTKYSMGIPEREETLFESEDKVIRRILRNGFMEVTVDSSDAAIHEAAVHRDVGGRMH